ncbi:MAG: DNA polymerase III subunit delta [Gammaproteobacteria bacterium]|nr:DNA polymerase III subunit delta [Gammaproteobacteria bacterium]
MNLRIDDLPTQLSQGLKPVYIISGDEPLQAGEACDAIRQQARTQGFSEREVMHAEKGFDWEQFLAASNSLSLFAEQRLIELRIPSGKPGDKGSKALQEYANNPAPDTVLLVIAGKIEKAAQNSKWYKALDAIAVSVQVWPVEAKMLPQWIRRRMQAKGMQPTADAITLLAERVEGNLLAAAQEIDKLLLLHGAGPVDFAAMAESVADSARYDIYGLVDAALSGDSKRVVRMLAGLKAEGAETVLLLWALTREIRSLEAMTAQLEQGERLEQVIAKYRVWPKRKPIVTAGLRRHQRRVWLHLLQRAAHLDLMIKGRKTGNVWDELLQLCLMMAGVRLFKSTSSLTI